MKIQKFKNFDQFRSPPYRLKTYRLSSSNFVFRVTVFVFPLPLELLKISNLWLKEAWNQVGCADYPVEIMIILKTEKK